jgi:hypothetical protein
MSDRGDTRPTSRAESAPGALRRRGLLAAVAALAAGVAVQQTTRTAVATSGGGPDGPLVLGSNFGSGGTPNTATRLTILTPAATYSGSSLLFDVDATGGAGGTDLSGVYGNAKGTGNGVIGVSGGGSIGIHGSDLLSTGVVGFGEGARTGVNGVSGSGVGVLGQTTSTANAAVSGQNSGAGDGVFGNSTSGIGVHGNSNAQTAVYGNTGSGVGARGDATSGTGVIGTSAQNNGVFGLSPGAGNGVVGQSGNGNGVLGQATSGGNGVQGLTTSGTGVFGSAGSGTGVFGTSASGAGVAGTSANNNGVFGDASGTGNGVFARTANGNGLVAQATGSGNAASFFGAVIVNGNFTVGPAFVKSGSVAFTDGSVRRLYATEAPESWFEDFGEAQLVNGRASVPIPADFAQAVNTSVPYHVFAMPHTADVESLAVTVRAADHFEVEANGKGQVTGSFSYRIVAKRKDVVAPRFERVTLPAAPATAALDAAGHAPVAPVPLKLPDLPAGAQQIPPVQPPPTPSVPTSRDHRP